MTDHKAHVRVLKGFAAAYTGETGEAFRAAIAALTAAPAASEGEDGARSIAFDSAEALADWLEALHEADGPAVMCGKWEPAQVAARAIREHLATQPAARRVTDEDVEAVERAVGFSARGWDMADPKEIIAAARESFAQPAEGVPRKKHDGPCWRNSHADCGC